MKKQTRFLTAAILNILLVVLAVIGAVKSVHSHKTIPASLVYYTQDSNIFLGISSLVYAIASVKAYVKGVFQIPSRIRKMKYYSICCIAVTLCVVLFILAPMASSIGGLKWILFTDSMLYQHLLSPVIAIAGFLLFEKEPELSLCATFSALIPTLIYAAVLYPLNIAGIVDGPYPFLQVRNMSAGMSVLWFFIILVLSYTLAWGMWFLNRKIPVFRGSETLESGERK